MTKKFDCVEMKRKGAEKVSKELTGLSRQEELEFWKTSTKKLLQKQATIHRNSNDPKAA